MKCMDRSGNEIKQNEAQDRVLSFLYHTALGRGLLSILVQPIISKVAGVFLDHPISKILIGPFVSKNNIQLSDFEKQEFYSYNDFFTRKIKKENRLISQNPLELIAPCDGKLSVYSITEESTFKVKDTLYTMKSLVQSEKLAKRYEGGQLLLFRLTVDDYHRYCYIDAGEKTSNHYIPGVFHTVNPIANSVVPIYKENTREFSLLKSEHFGTILMMEVGALLVGKIVNYQGKVNVQRGEEKGRFEFGGSTVIICLEKNCGIVDQDIIKNSLEDIETVVKMGERIGETVVK